MAEGVLLSISLIVGIATLLTIIAKLIKQPPLISYLIAGVIVGPLFLKIIGPQAASSEFIQLFAHIGVALLLFIVGLSLDFGVLKDVGGVSLFAGLGQVITTALFGGLIALGLGYSYVPALYLAAALAFSSTVLVVKILSDKKEMETLHARIALGILIVQDFVAALVLMIIPVMQGGNVNNVFINIGGIIALIIGIFLFSTFVLKKFMHFLAKSQEVLFLFGIAWALIIAALFDLFGFSIEIGALIAGMSLASSRYTLELGGKIKPLRDFFTVLFFVFFGSQLAGTISLGIIWKAIILSLFVLIGNPLIIMGIMRFLGYKKRTNFLVGVSMAQISEFSLILILLGFTLGHISQEVMSLSVIIAIITIGVSSYGLYYSHSIFDKLSGILGIFESKKYKATSEKTEGYDVVLFGYNRVGHDILQMLRKTKTKFIVVDYNPRVVLSLSEKGIKCIYGDASDKEFIDELKLGKVKLVISTILDIGSNLTIKKRLDEVNSKATFIATSNEMREALDLYNEGVDYVIVPQILGGKYASTMIQKYKTDVKKYKKDARAHIKEIKERIKEH